MGYLLLRELAEKKNKKVGDVPKLYWIVSRITMLWGSYLYPEYKLFHYGHDSNLSKNKIQTIPYTTSLAKSLTNRLKYSN